MTSAAHHLALRVPALLLLAACGEAEQARPPQAPPPPPPPVAAAATSQIPVAQHLALRPDAAEDDEDRALVALLERGLEGLVDATHGTLWDAGEGPPTWLSAPQVATRGAALTRALEEGLGAARCLGGRCLVRGADGALWLLRLKRRPGGGRLLAGALRSSGPPDPARYARWLHAIRDRWSEPTGALIGEALSSEEAGELAHAIKALGRAHRRDPDNAWVLYHLVRLLVAYGEPKLGYLALRSLAERDDPEAVARVRRLSEAPALAAFREHSAVAELLREAAAARRGVGSELDQLLRPPGAP